MIATAPLPPETDMALFCAHVGQPNESKRVYRGGVLEIEGVDQATVDAAVATMGAWYTAAALAKLKADLRDRIDAKAEALRQSHLTQGVGMAMTYMEKHAQAVAVEQMGETAANALSAAEAKAQFPTLAASLGIEADTLYACAELVISRYEALAAASHDIEACRLTGKKLIGLASDAAAARAAFEAITWPT